MTKMFLSIIGLDDTDVAEGEIEMPIVPIGTTLRFDNSLTEDVYFVDIEGYDIHMRPINNVSTAIHIHAFARVNDRSSFDDISTLNAAAFEDASQVNFSKRLKGSLVP